MKNSNLNDYSMVNVFFLVKKVIQFDQDVQQQTAKDNGKKKLVISHTKNR